MAAAGESGRGAGSVSGGRRELARTRRYGDLAVGAEFKNGRRTRHPDERAELVSAKAKRR